VPDYQGASVVGAGSDFDFLLSRVAGPLSIEVAQLDSAARARWEGYAADHGWREVDWFDMPGAFLWRREPPGVWELTWQQTAGASEMFDVRLLPPENSLVWRRQVVDFVQELGVVLARAITLVDEATATPLIAFDPDGDRVRRAPPPAPRPLDRPSGQLCCEAMRAQFEDACDVCMDPQGCPHQLVVYVPKTGDFGLPIRDGGSGYTSITHCPWCGTNLSPGVSGGASAGESG
jgi:hypothetical protein